MLCRRGYLKDEGIKMGVRKEMEVVVRRRCKDTPRARDRHKHTPIPQTISDGPSRQRHAKLRIEPGLAIRDNAVIVPKRLAEEGLRDDGGRDLEHHVPVETGAHKPAQQRCVRKRERVAFCSVMALRV